MKKWILTVFAVLVANSYSGAQVIANFESGLNGYQITNWGTALDSLRRIPDPTGKSLGVLQAKFAFPMNSFAKGAFNVSSAISARGAEVITYWVYLPLGIPDSLHIAVFAQDNSTYLWNQANYSPKDIPKEVWYPLSFDLAQTVARDSINVTTAQIFTGIQIDNGPSQDSAWTGVILVDNVSLIGVQPVTIADFETGLDGFQAAGWGTALTGVQQTADPTGISSGVLQASFNFLAGAFSQGAIDLSTPISAAAASALTFWVYLPQGIPDALSLVVFAQDDSTGIRSTTRVSLTGIPRLIWYPVSFDLSQAVAGATITLSTKGVITGLQLDTGSDSSFSWSGSILIDNVEFWTNVVVPPPKKYLLADFTTWGDLGGFAVDTAVGAAVTGLTNGVDTTNAANRVLVVSYSFSDTGAVVASSGTIARNGISFFSASNDTTATDITIDVYIPPDMPDSARFTVAFLGPATNNQWTQDQLLLAGGVHDVHRGRWNTLKYSVANHIADHSITNTRANGTFMVEASYASPLLWRGEIFFDNLTLLGIDNVTSISQGVASPYEYRLDQNYPNPFNPTTTIRYELRFASFVSLRVYDLLGREVATLVNEAERAGPHAVVFHGDRLASGAYFCVLRAGAVTKIDRMLLLK